MQDDVTNRLTAKGSYGVTIAEDFTPPENLVPGQKVNKDVSIVNTRNIDALVRVHLEGAMNVLKENAVSSEIDIKTGFGSTTLTDVADADLIALGLTKKDGIANFYRTLSTKERVNPKLNGDGDDTALNDNTYSEVKTVQAGGYLAYASGNFEFTPENAGYTYVNTENKTVTQSSATKVTSTAIKDSWNNSGSGGAGLAIDSDTFVPTSSGLFIFRRNITLSNQTSSGESVTGTNAQEYEFSGYYAVVDGDTVTYYALHYLPNEKDATTGKPTYNSDYVIYSTAQTAEQNGNANTNRTGAVRRLLLLNTAFAETAFFRESGFRRDCS